MTMILCTLVTIIRFKSLPNWLARRRIGHILSGLFSALEKEIILFRIYLAELKLAILYLFDIVT
jgi:hypothetical protein